LQSIHLRYLRNLRAKMSEECLSACEGFASGGKFFSHADLADLADLPYGCERDNNVPVAQIAQIG
jgi:hypothetical protein